MKKIGYTNRKLDWTDLFKGGIIESTVNLEEHNEIKACFCSQDRFHKCSALEVCLRLEPQSYHEKRVMVNKTVVDSIVPGDEEKISEYLKSKCKECRRIEIDIKEMT